MKLEITKVEGIVISESNYKETSKLINILTKEYGIVGILAKGSKNIKNKNRIFTSRLTHANYQIYYRPNKLSTLICADLIDSFSNTKQDLTKISYSCFLLELTSQVVKNNNDKNIFDILLNSLIKIENGYDPSIITNIAELKYLDFLGIKPILNSCAVCGSTNILTVSTNKGGFVCVNCHTNEAIVSSKTIKLLRLLYYVDISKISKIKISNDSKEEIDRFINEYYDKYSGLYLKSKKFLKTVKNTYI